MRTKRYRKDRFFSLVYISAFTAVFLLVSLPLASVGLVVVDGEAVAVAFLSKVNITLAYVHSVEHYSVVEKYLLEGCGLKLIELEWAGFGAGMPSSPGDLEGSVLDRCPTGGLRAKVDFEIGERVTIAAKHMSHPRLLINGKEVRVRENMTISTCLKTSLLELAIRYIVVALLGRSSTVRAPPPVNS